MNIISTKDLTTNPEFNLHWQMTNCEKFAMQDLLHRLQPKLSFEIGTYKGGSLQVIAHFSERVISIDIDPTVKNNLKDKFSNVEFCCGSSEQVLPDIFKQLQNLDLDVEFILIDGDHSTEGVRNDVNLILKYLKPRKPCVILMHDSFNPACRQGINTASWDSSSFVQWVELDFIPGIYHHKAYDTAAARTMWGGFACAILEPNPRHGELLVQASQQGLFDAVYQNSSHFPHKKNGTFYLFNRIKSKLSQIKQGLKEIAKINPRLGPN